MPKEDFCFTYYDGDAARDKAHMTRLERGAYDDIISAQRKRGHLSTNDIKRVLGSDYEICWPSLEWVLKQDEEQKYFIEWVETSLQRAQKFSQKQKENGCKGGRPKTQTKPKQNPGVSQDITQTITQKKPLEDEYVNEDEKDELEGTGEREERLLPDENTSPLDLHLFELTMADIRLTCDYLESTCSKQFADAATKNQWLAPPEIERQWTGFKIQYFTKQQYESWQDVMQHFRDWLKRSIQKQISNGNAINGQIVNPAGKRNFGKSSGVIRRAHALAAEFGLNTGGENGS